MSILIFLLTAMMVHGFANNLMAQRVTLNKTNATISEVIEELRRQSGYDFLIKKELVNKAQPISIHTTDEALASVLTRILDNQNLTYSIMDDIKSVVIKEKSSNPSPTPLILAYEEVKGRVVDSLGHGLLGASVKVKGYQLVTKTDRDGYFTLRNVPNETTLEISFIGYISQEVKSSATVGTITLVASPSDLDEVMVIGYGQTSKRLNTGSVSTVSAEEIEQQPVTNVLSALSGRMPGVFVQTTNGLPGGNINVQIRGKSSLTAGSDPLYIIDGVPFVSSSLVTNTALAGGINGAINPLNSINPDIIETITVLKDADATAIYGSRGANGVILITTKKGKQGAVRVSLNSSIGTSMVANFPKVLGLQDYLEIRREAFANDNLIPSADPQSTAYAPDLTVWDTTRSTDWAKYFMGNSATSTNTQLSLSGGSEHTSFYVSANYRSETGVTLGDNLYQRGGTQIGIEHRSPNGRFSFNSSLSLTKDANRLSNPVTAMEAIIQLPPNFPLYNPDGNYNWTTNTNPLAAMTAATKSKTDNIMVNTSLVYELTDGLNVKVNLGTNRLALDQVIVNPKSAQDPANNAISNTYFGNRVNNSFLIEPQIDYSLSRSLSTISVMIGGTWQSNIREGQTIFARNFNSEQMLENLGSAGTTTPTNTYLEYKYASAFGRLSYNYAGKYIINASARRDGSSKFGPNNRFGNFGAIGAAWIVSNERWIKEHIKAISHAKIRASYGITGNDQITEYQYLSTYGTSNYVYEDVVGVTPSRVANADFKWESNKKFELGMELGLLKDKLFATVNWFDNRSGNQLINYALPWTTGFNNYQANLPALIENTGWELEINSQNIKKESFSWNTTFNITLQRNKLINFPGIENTSYSNIYRIGESILREYGYRFAYVDEVTGQAQYQLVDGGTSPAPAFENFYFTKGDRNPTFYGGFGNSVSYKNVHLDIFAQFARQRLPGGLTSIGMLRNGFSTALDRWQKQGDLTSVPRASTQNDTYYWRSSANYFDVSYFRLKNISLNFDIKGNWPDRLKVNQLNAYFQAQNLFTIWNRNTAIYDPESGASTNIPPLRSFVFGIQLTL
jgi:TonB-linked outer membrane protein, SusC/RagA family